MPIEDAVSEEYKKELREQMLVFKKQKEDELAKREKEFLVQTQHKEAEFAKKLQGRIDLLLTSAFIPPS